MSEGNSYGYNYSRCIVAAITATFQFVLILSVYDEPIPYLLSNVSILGGYILDIIVLLKSYPTLRGFIVTVLWGESITLTAALSDILYISVYGAKNEFSEYTEMISHLIVPIVTLLALFLYLILDLIITIKQRKDFNDFI